LRTESIVSVFSIEDTKGYGGHEASEVQEQGGGQGLLDGLGPNNTCKQWAVWITQCVQLVSISIWLPKPE